MKSVFSTSSPQERHTVKVQKLFVELVPRQIIQSQCTDWYLEMPVYTKPCSSGGTTPTSLPQRYRDSSRSPYTFNYKVEVGVSAVHSAPLWKDVT